MRTGKITIQEKEYILCFSTRVLMRLEERGGNADAELKRIMEGGKISDLFWLLAQMVDAGDRYARLEGLDNPGTLSLDDMADLIGVDDYPKMLGALTDTMQKGNTPTIQTKAEKNAKTTQEE